MNAGIVIKIEYRLLTHAEFTGLRFTGFSGTISKNTQETSAGIIHETHVKLKIPNINETITALLDCLLNRKAQFRITDGNGKQHLVGDDSFPARLSYTQGIDGSPGSWNGYQVTVNHKSPCSYLIS